MPQSWTRCLLAEGTLANAVRNPDGFSQIKMQRKKITFSTVKIPLQAQLLWWGKYSVTPPHQHCHRTLLLLPSPNTDKCISGRWTLNSCVFSVSFSTQRVHVWVMATGRPDTPWQTRPWADRTNAITPHSAHSAAAQNTAISYLSRQLCLRRGIQKRELAFYHTNASLGTERNDKHVTDLTRI